MNEEVLTYVVTVTGVTRPAGSRLDAPGTGGSIKLLESALDKWYGCHQAVGTRFVTLVKPFQWSTAAPLGAQLREYSPTLDLDCR